MPFSRNTGRSDGLRGRPRSRRKTDIPLVLAVPIATFCLSFAAGGCSSEETLPGVPGSSALEETRNGRSEGDGPGSSLEIPGVSPGGPTTTVVITLPESTALEQDRTEDTVTVPQIPGTTGPPQGEIDFPE